MKLEGVIDVVTLILVAALFVLLVRKSGAFGNFLGFASGVFNKSIAALGGQSGG